MSDATCMEIKDTTANPAPLGLFGFGMTTVLLNIHNAGIYELGSMVLAMGIFYGGMCQIIAGIMEWKKKNTFGTVAFTSYGAFWLTLVALIVMPKLGWIEKTSTRGMVCYLVMWGIFTFLMFIGTLKAEPRPAGRLRNADAACSFCLPSETRPGTRPLKYLRDGKASYAVFPPSMRE